MVAAGAPPCSVCGATTRAGARFCGECGAPVGAPGSTSNVQPARHGETSTTQTGLPLAASASQFSGQVPNVDAGRYSKVSRSLAVTRGGVGPVAPPRDADGSEPAEAAKDRPKRRRDRTMPDVGGVGPGRPVPEPAPPAPPVRLSPPLGPDADPQAPTDPALMLGLGPAGAPLPPIDVPGPSDEDDEDDRPTRTRTSSPSLSTISSAQQPAFGPEAHAARDAAAALGRDAPPPFGSDQSGSDKSEFQRLLEEVETGFDSILDEASTAGVPTTGRAGSEFDSSEVRILFDQIAVDHARPVRDFMVEVKLGEPPKSWIAFCRPAVKSLERSARGMDLAPLAGALEGFMSALDLAESESGSEGLVREQARQMLIDAYSDLIARMPQAFGLESESNEREAVIVHALLAQVPGLHALGRDRLYEAGMTSLALYFVAKARDLVDAARLDPSVADRIVERFAGYRREASALVPDDGRAVELSRLEALADILERSVESYEEASSSWGAGSGALRKELRRARADASAQVRLLLARLGELDLCAATDALTTTAKVASLRAFIADARRSWKPASQGGS